jgi:hypothetical protein
VLSGASLPKKIKREEAKTVINRWFKDPLWISSENFHKIPDRIKLFKVEIDELEEKKNFKTVQQNIKAKERTIVFCQQQETAKNLNEFLAL